MENKLSESELIRNAKEGDSEAFILLCEQNNRRLWQIASTIACGSDREDLIQDTIIRAYTSLQSYRAEASFSAWLCRIAVNSAHDYHKSAWRRRVTLGLEDLDAGKTSGTELEEIVLRKELRKHINHAVAELPSHQRVPIWLIYFEEFSIAEISRLENVSESTIRSRVNAGLKKLAFALKDLPGESEILNPVQPIPKGCSA